MSRGLSRIILWVSTPKIITFSRSQTRNFKLTNPQAQEAAGEFWDGQAKGPALRSTIESGMKPGMEEPFNGFSLLQMVLNNLRHIFGLYPAVPGFVR
jgi:hypothetical protein